MLIAVLAAGLLLAQATAPEAAPGPPAPAQAGKPAVTISDKAPKPKMICERETSTDSFISKKVCRTPEEVEAMRKASREQTKATQDFYRECRGSSC